MSRDLEFDPPQEQPDGQRPKRLAFLLIPAVIAGGIAIALGLAWWIVVLALLAMGLLVLVST